MVDGQHRCARNRGRFAPLHSVAEQLVCDLVSEFRVQRTDAFGLDPELEGRCELARASVRLAPEDTTSAPILISFSAFPGIQMRLGHWHIMALPAPRHRSSISVCSMRTSQSRSRAFSSSNGSRPARNDRRKSTKYRHVRRGAVTRTQLNSYYAKGGPD